MILADHEILREVCTNHLSIKPFTEKNIQPNSYDVTLSNSFQLIQRKTADDNPVDPYDSSTWGDMYQPYSGDYIDLKPGQTLLGSTIESFRIPADMCARIEGKSSVARLGIDNHKTAGWIDAGFTGTITLELTNHQDNTVRLWAGMPIAQIAFFRCSPARVPYNLKAGAKYNGQMGATVSRYYENAFNRDQI